MNGSRGKTFVKKSTRLEIQFDDEVVVSDYGDSHGRLSLTETV
jgi:hypothetical protein